MGSSSGHAASVLAGFSGDFRALRSTVQQILHSNAEGDRLNAQDFRLVREILEYHPEAASKVGVGVQAIKVDASLHEGSRCFWVIRRDGTTEDFSVRRCLRGIR